MKTPVSALILAAGKGSRFRSATNKVLHPILGASMLRLVIEAVRGLSPDRLYVVVGHQKDAVMDEAAPLGVEFVHQRQPKGTGDAVAAAKSVLAGRPAADCLIVPADVPLLRPADLRALLSAHRKSGYAATVLSAVADDPSGYGRIVREPETGRIRIVEESDASRRVKDLREVNTSVYVFRIPDLLRSLPKISERKAKGERYLTDVIGVLSAAGKGVGVLQTAHPENVLQVNTRFDLSLAAHALRLRKILELSDKGVTVLDPLSTWIDLDVKIGPDTVIYPSVVIEGRTTIGRGCRIDASACLRNSRLGNDVHVRNATVMENVAIEDGVSVGPFARLRPKTVLRAGSYVGNFVEIKATDFGRGSKAGHLSYLGDSEVGDAVNIGAGTITCNYDGVRKNRTVIEAGAFIGSGTELIAPVRVGRGAYIGAGSVITKDVAPGALAVSRSRQIEKTGWARRLRKRRAQEHQPDK